MNLRQYNLNTLPVVKLIEQKKGKFWFSERKDSGFWFSEQKKRSLRLFHRAAENVPAYKDFLKKNNIDPEKIKNWEDFQKVPVMNKNNYLKTYSLKKLCWNGTLNNKSIVFTATSGSTGEPFYFPREHNLDWQYSFTIESFLKKNKLKNGPTLVIIGFGMGVWIGGIITYKAFEIASQRGDFKVSIITPGINKSEIFNALKNLSPYFSSTILVGYPPFVKDIIDEASGMGISLKKINLRLVFAAESFNEKFREYLVKKGGIKNQFLDTMNIYGSADIGAMAAETPLSIFIRKMALKNKDLFSELFSDADKVPTLAQFNPLFINFESVNKNILITGNNTIPLIRYAIGDCGGVFSLDEASDIFKKHGINLLGELKKLNIHQGDFFQLPFVYVYERKDFAIKLYGATIYPEHIREALLHPRIAAYLTGKFTLIKKFDKKHNQYMEINCELQKDKLSSGVLKNKIKRAIIKKLIEKNAEYHNNFKSIPKKIEPRIVLWPHEHTLYFKPGTKQKWVNPI